VFEFDPEKSAVNLVKHGIDFETAQLLWSDDYRIESDARSDDEPRVRVTGMINGKLWSAFVTPRGQAIRIISVRRARDNEAKQYGS
jgi:uncharacterized protein